MAKKRKQRGMRAAATASGKPPGAAPAAGRLNVLNAARRRIAIAGQWLAAHRLMLALAAMILAAYWPAYFAGFVWDDKVFLDASAMLSLRGLADIWLTPGSLVFEGHYWPVVYTTFWLEHKAWAWTCAFAANCADHGFNPLPFHLLNIALHGVNTILLWRLLQRLAVPGAWLAAAVFALHPAHVEAVAWVIARKDLLATLFYLLAADCWLRYRELSSAASKRHANSRLRSASRAYLALTALFTAGMLSKSFVITLPAAMLVWAWWKHGRIAAGDCAQAAPLLLLGGGIIVFDLIQYSARADLELDYSFIERMLIAAKALWFYAGKLLWPHPLLAIYPLWDTAPGKWLNWLPLLAALGLAAGLYLARERIGRGPLAGALFFAITLSPVLGFGDNAFMLFAFAADRYQYLASAGLIAVLSAAATVAYGRLAGMAKANEPPPESAVAKQYRGGTAEPLPENQAGAGRSSRAGARRGIAVCAAPAGRTLAGLLLAACGALTFRHAHTFQNEIALFSHVVAHNPRAYHIHFNLGNALMEAKRFDEAAAALAIAAERNPETVNIHINRGVVALETERYQDAEISFRRAIALEAGNFHAKQNLAAALRRQKRFEESLAAMRDAAALLPSPPGQHYYFMAQDAVELSRHEDAERYLRQALQADPAHAKARQQLLFIYLDAARYEAALQLEPALPQVLEKLAYASYNEGRVEEALNLYRHSTAISPDNPHAHANLGAALAQLGRYQEALQSLNQALTLNPQHEAALANIDKVREMLHGER